MSNFLTEDHDSWSGIRTTIFTQDDGSAVVESAQDVTDIVETAKTNFNQHDERSRWKGEWHHVSFMPLPTYFKLRKKAGGDEREFNKLVAKWVNDRENRSFRTRPGQI